MSNALKNMIPEETHLLKCPKCGVLWRSVYSHDLGGEQIQHYTYEDPECPSGCINFFGFRKWGKCVNVN